MHDYSWFQPAQWLKLLLPYFLAVLTVILAVIQLPVPFLGLMRPDILLIIVYFWALYRPDFFPIPLIFVTALTMDLIYGPAVGLSPLLHIIVFLLVKGQRRFLLAQSFVVQWLCFGLAACLKIGLEWAVVSALYLSIASPSYYLLLWLFSILAYPFLALLFIRIHRLIGKGAPL